MSDIIQLLPDSVANQIAAGEVIQRPASVIKELVENAVDAGARNIHVTVTDAGRTNIQVIDDGKGMSETDARLAFERHSTSKIRKADDLFALRTMGFRGEALASIAAVAQVELKSRQATDEIGTLIRISGSRYEKQEPCSCAVGSLFSVSNIFYNVPARRKFLKSNSTELNNILTAFERIALVNPQITFTLHSNGTEVFNLRAANLRQRILDVFGKRFNQELLPVNVETTMCKVSGFVGKPESARKKGVHQFFFVNGRYMKHPYFNKAVMAAYDRLVPQGEQVPYFLYFDVDPKDIDVNIHPTKTEIKFENEQAIWQILSASVKESIGMFNDVPTIDFDTEGKPDIPAFDANPYMPAKSAPPRTSFDPSYNPFDTSSVVPPSSYSSAYTPKTTHDWQPLFHGLEREKETPAYEADVFPEEQSVEAEEEQVPDYPVTVFLSKEGYLKKITAQSLRMSGEQKFKEGDSLRDTVESTNRAEMLVFTDRCQCYKTRLSDFEDGKASLLGDYLPQKLGMDPGENVLQVIFPGDSKGFVLFFFENGKVAKVPLSAYETKTNRKKLTGAFSDKSPVVRILSLAADTQIAVYSSDGRAMIFSTADLLPKTTRNTIGVAVMSLKKKAVLQNALLLEESGIENQSRYRTKTIPAAGAILKEEDSQEKQATFEI